MERRLRSTLGVLARLHRSEGKAKGLDLAGYGVTIFFTFSGFLITYLLLKEKELDRLRIKDFYARRVL